MPAFPKNEWFLPGMAPADPFEEMRGWVSTTVKALGIEHGSMVSWCTDADMQLHLQIRGFWGSQKVAFIATVSYELIENAPSDYEVVKILSNTLGLLIEQVRTYIQEHLND